MNKFLIDFERDHNEPGDWDIGRISKLIQQKRFQVKKRVKFTLLENESIRRSSLYNSAIL